MSSDVPTPTTTALPTGRWSADQTHSSAGFAIRAVGTFRAGFDDVSATLVVSDDGGVELAGAVSAESLHVKNDRQRAHLLSPDFFDAGRFPELSFRATSLRRRGDAVTLEGDLTIRDQTHPITATGRVSDPVTALDGGVRFGLALETTIDRTDYGVAWNAPLPLGGLALGDAVTITVDLDFVRTEAEG